MSTLDALNQLDREIADAEDALGRDALTLDDRRWDLAELASNAIDASSVSKVAAGWINPRTGKPYSKSTAGFVHQAWRKYGSVPLSERPPFGKAVREFSAKKRPPNPLAFVLATPANVAAVLAAPPDLDLAARHDARKLVNAAIAALRKLHDSEALSLASSGAPAVEVSDRSGEPGAMVRVELPPAGKTKKKLADVESAKSRRAS